MAECEGSLSHGIRSCISFLFNISDLHMYGPVTIMIVSARSVVILNCRGVDLEQTNSNAACVHNYKLNSGNNKTSVVAINSYYI